MKLFRSSILLLFCAACSLQDPPPYGRNGNEVRFSNLDWWVKTGSGPQGPGPNYFSSRPEDLFLDNQGRLHLRIAQHDGVWYSTELVGYDTVGYGTYTWVVTGDLENIAANTVLGLFTWNTQSFFEAANSEVDIEFAKWGDSQQKRTLHQSVQPVNFGPYYPERSYAAPTEPGELIGTSTHRFVWTDSLILWTSWKGTDLNSEPIASWSFGLDNPPRVKNEGGAASQPIVIPKPLNHTNVRINYWLLGGVPPTDGQPHEIIIESFDYVPF